jgi:hypothetical protein
MTKQEILRGALELIWALLETVAMIRLAIATYRVAFEVTQDQTYALFTTTVVEGVAFCALFLIGQKVIAAPAALIALAFSGVMQYLELKAITHTLTADQTEQLYFAIAFAPLIIIGVGFLGRLADDEVQGEGAWGKLFARVGDWFKPHDGAPTKSYAFDVPRGKPWKETRLRWRDANGKKHSRGLPRGKNKKSRRS